jgi:SEC-C motif-containing protein
MQHCHCNSGILFDDCCGIFIKGAKLPICPEELMRSRYTAYTLGNIDYIANTMRPPASDNFDRISAANWAKNLTWIKLEVIKSYREADRGFVEFLAYFEDAHKQHVMHELSEFHLLEGRWFYVIGYEPKAKHALTEKLMIGRNEPCHCGSDKKFKKCCGLQN